MDDLKMLFKGVIVHFAPSEIKEAYGTIYEIDREISEDWDAHFAWRSVRNSIEEYLVLRQEKIVKKINDDKMSARELIFNMAYNISAEEIEVLSCDSMSRVGSRMRGFENLNKYVTKKINRLNGH